MQPSWVSVTKLLKSLYPNVYTGFDLRFLAILYFRVETKKSDKNAFKNKSKMFLCGTSYPRSQDDSIFLSYYNQNTLKKSL